MNLPPALTPWAPFLQEFPLAVAPALGQMAQRIAALVGASGQAFDQDEGEVDGYDGLTRRGLPERLLVSEWLLAGEAPDEWIRRASEGELAFLKLARRAPQSSRAVVAIFDAGPDALGAPRLGQLAALLVLARRAREMNAELVWGIAQKPTAQRWRDVSPSGVEALLAARGSAPPTANDLDFWRAELGECDERWLVGGSSFAALAAPDESRLEFDDPLEIGRGLEVSAHLRGRQTRHGETRRARLELPPDAVCTRLLRDPLGAVSGSAAQVRRIKPNAAPTSNFVWINGHTLAARSKLGGIVVLRVPSSPRGGVAKPKHHQVYPPGEVHFVGYHDGSILIARVQGEGIEFQHLGGKGRNIATGFYKILAGAVPTMTDAPLRALWNLNGNAYRPFLLLPDGTLRRLLPHHPVPGALVVGEPECLRVHIAGGNEQNILALFEDTEQKSTDILRLKADVSAEHGFTASRNPTLHSDVQTAFCVIGGNSTKGENLNMAWAFQSSQGWSVQWYRRDQMVSESCQVGGDETVMGVVWAAPRWPTPGLLVSGVRVGGLEMRGPDWRFSLAPSEHIESVAVSNSTPYIAWATAHEVTVYSVVQDAILARWQWGETG